jgi:two-component system, NarL family, response regulator LiaR
MVRSDLLRGLDRTNGSPIELRVRGPGPLSRFAQTASFCCAEGDLGKVGLTPSQLSPTREHRRPITVVLVDEESLIRTALSQALAAGAIDLVGEAANGEDALRVVVDVRPDVVLMDLRLPGISGVQTIERLGLLAPASRILVLTRSEQNRVVEAIVAGASGYILKSAAPEAIIAAVSATAAGESVLSSQIAGKLLERIRERDIPITTASHDAAVSIRAALTVRELEIFKLLASGESNQDIGRELSLSANTVANHIASILAKLHLDNRIQAAVQAVRAGIA